MTDKQIIIDDLMKQLNEKTVAIMLLRETLDRKEQECEMWKNLTIDNGAVALKYQQQIDQLKAENKELKKQVDITQMFLDACNNSCEHYKQTLTEIKEICNNNDELKCDFNLVDCDKYKLGKHNLANRILQKISECEGNDEH